MTIHYHGTPISPMTALYDLAGRHFCVSHAHPQDVERVHRIGQSVMLDNGAFSKWRSNKIPDWPNFYAWCEEWLSCPTTWAVIPDVIDGGSQIQEALMREWPFAHRGAPVWHMDEPLDRLLKLVDEWPKVCIGSTQEYASVLSLPWQRRITEMWNEVSKRRRFLPWLHMLRGMQLSGGDWPFASLDSTDIGRNHHRSQNSPKGMAERWDSRQCAGSWDLSKEQTELPC